MRLGLVLGYGNAFGVESGQWGGGRGVNPPPFKRFPGGGTRAYGRKTEPRGADRFERRIRLSAARCTADSPGPQPSPRNRSGAFGALFLQGFGVPHQAIA